MSTDIIALPVECWIRAVPWARVLSVVLAVAMVLTGCASGGRSQTAKPWSVGSTTQRLDTASRPEPAAWRAWLAVLEVVAEAAGDRAWASRCRTRRRGPTSLPRC